MLRFPVIVRAALLLAVVASAGAGCRREIGDECTTAADCNPNGSRQCDATQPGGYCTIQGCDETSCPEEAMCIRYFPSQFLTEPCAPNGSDTGCSADELCVDGKCARRSTELRYCVKRCEGNGDCRSGYECRLAGTRGSIPLTSSSDPNARFQFCAPQAN